MVEIRLNDNCSIIISERSYERVANKFDAFYDYAFDGIRWDAPIFLVFEGELELFRWDADYRAKVFADFLHEGLS